MLQMTIGMICLVFGAIGLSIKDELVYFTQTMPEALSIIFIGYCIIGFFAIILAPIKKIKSIPIENIIQNKNEEAIPLNEVHKVKLNHPKESRIKLGKNKIPKDTKGLILDT